MPIDPSLSEAHWKSDGLTKRTTVEKVKSPKTGVSEALRAYASVGNLGIDRLSDKQTRLKAIKVALTKCKSGHRSNAKFVAYIDNVEHGLVRETDRLNHEIAALTLDAILANQGLYTAFHDYCNGVEHNPEPLEFLHDLRAGVPIPTILATYVQSRSAKEVNVDGPSRQAWIAAPGDANARGKVVHAATEGILHNELPRFKQRIKVNLA